MNWFARDEHDKLCKWEQQHKLLESLWFPQRVPWCFMVERISNPAYFLTFAYLANCCEKWALSSANRTQPF